MVKVTINCDAYFPNRTFKIVLTGHYVHHEPDSILGQNATVLPELARNARNEV